MRVLLPALALLLLLAGCGGEPEAPPVTPSLAPTAVPLSFTPVRDAVGAELDLAGARWATCFQSYDRRGEMQQCHNELAGAAEVAARMDAVIDTLPNRGGYDDVSSELSTFGIRHAAYVRDGCESGYARDSEPCAGHYGQMVSSWVEAAVELEKIEPSR